MSEKYTSTEQKVSYGIGRQMGDQLAGSPFDELDLQSVLDGISDAFTSQPSQISTEEMKAAFEAVNERVQKKQAETAGQLTAEGEKFLADNAQRAGITVTASGLQYEVLSEGKGAMPSSSAKVRTHYHGTLLDGTVFDSSYDRGEPAEFPVNGVIAGWTEALQLMKEGAKWRLYVPSALAYGEKGAGGAIGPHATLIFDVELLAIVD
ncbi:MAG: FKBP-type peptidyl-prolyl cis-trans isomerase [Gammaproteobacteria bacterium]|nr:FKBP-type peptidyl-prolyl cis-trans isomerase [Gammaproteobacteria bacterium]MBQ0839568.1 FKBP-type peptidyl-prolyl cis-trans isomerase [Gammaproteobacteria bacterium]